MFGKNKNSEEKDNNTLENKIDETADQEFSEAANTDVNTDNTSEDELSKEKQRAAELHEKYLRLYSDFENFRRRTNKEKAELIQYGNRDLLLKVLPLYDDLERAITLSAQTEDKAALVEGMGLIFKKFQSLLENEGLKVIESKGKVFDSELHDALTTIPAPNEEMKGKIIDEIQKGYTLNEKVLRHAKVVVGE